MDFANEIWERMKLDGASNYLDETNLTSKVSMEICRAAICLCKDIGDWLSTTTCHFCTCIRDEGHEGERASEVAVVKSGTSEVIGDSKETSFKNAISPTSAISLVKNIEEH